MIYILLFLYSQGWLQEKGGMMPQIPNDTRWNSHKACIETFIKNFYKYVEISNEHEDEIANNITTILSNTHLYRETADLQKQITEVAEALNKVNI